MSTAVTLDGSCTFYGGPDETTVVPPSSATRRFCFNCDCPIPLARLAANPRANSCVPCLEAAGDVAPLRRLDEGNEQTMFYAGNPRMERETHRVHRNIPGDVVMSDQTEAPVLIRPYRMRSHEQMADEIIESISYKENQ